MRKMTIPIILGLVMVTAILADESEPVTGWSWGGVPAIAYNSDTGFLYGIILNPFNYGDGSMYPDYKYSVYMEWSRTTKGSGINKLFFDSKYLLPKGIRVTGELSYLTEQSLPFYGFNGYESVYHPEYEDDQDPDYRTRVYYRHMRNQFKLTMDFQKQVLNPNLRGILGLGFLNNDIGPVDIATLNDGQADADKLPVYSDPDSMGLFNYYEDQGFISADEADGGKVNYLKLGAVYDTRDNEANPMHGMWTEVLILVSPSFLGSDFNYTELTLTHRQYFTLIPRNLSFAYRVGYQSVIAGDIPFFMLPYYQSSYQTQEGFGGSKTFRGILKNRVVGNSVVLFNTELRWKFFRTVVFGQNLYLALNAFVDGGQTLSQYGNDTYLNSLPSGSKSDSLHLSYGGGFRIALNENFIIAVDYGMAADEQDGTSGLYIGLGYLY
ncbi:MAG: BamA/TamA family outer membrane protein [FCB group bacterium]|nr:BamA/TamA family outer membrane protein [FCB group bacterium]